jgi:hypothetical protein
MCFLICRKCKHALRRKGKCKHYEILNNEVFDGTKQCPDHGVPQDSSCKVAIKNQEIELSSKEK